MSSSASENQNSKIGNDIKITRVVTIVHDNTDEVKLCITKLKRNLIYVVPSVTFQYCLFSEFQDEIFQKNQNVLVFLSKQTESFRKRIYASYVKFKRVFLATPIRLCIVAETDNLCIEEKYVTLIGRDNIALVHSLRNSFAWLPKVCVFLFKPSKPRTYLQKCVIPRTIEDPNLAFHRQSLIKSLTDLQVYVSEDLNEIPVFHCGFLLRKREEETIAKFIRKKLNANKAGGPTILDYVMHFEEKLYQDEKKRVTFAQESQVLFVLNLLFIVGLIDIHTINGERVRQRMSKAIAFWENLPWVDLIGCCVLSLLNPGLIVYFLTPIPYISLFLSGITGRKFIWTFCLTFWMVLSLLAIYGVSLYFAAISDYLLYILAGLWVVFIFSSICTYMIVKLGSEMFEKFRALSLI